MIDFVRILLVGLSLTFGANGMYVLPIEDKISKQQPCGRGNCGITVQVLFSEQNKNGPSLSTLHSSLLFFFSFKNKQGISME